MNPFTRIWQYFFSKPTDRPASKFVDLAPTSNADQTGIYHEALEFATNNNEVLNIALTGPYGSGKSSVIKSFLLKYQRPKLELSLASFLPEGEVPGVRVSKQEIERSILQQILYGAGSNKLPLSRFKRIQIPEKWSAASSLAVCTGLFCLWYIVTNHSNVMSGKFFKPFELSNWFNIVTFAFGSLFVWRLVHTAYLKSLGLSLKSISLKDIQIAPEAADEESILNRHLDEIIYFFQSTEYDLVVIEDLDRFDNPDIFVTLREINALVNENADIHRRIRFLYALRDDIFINTDRTKFFEFIVPVIPVINHSNSIDKVLEHTQRIDLDRRLDRRFVREVSRYLSDLRLIANIFNEYVIYASNLRADGDGALDPNKLLAVLIYKNVMPKDFAALHRQEGALSKVLNRYDEFVEKSGEAIRSQLKEIEADLLRSDEQFVRHLAELHRIYAMAMVERIPQFFTHLHTNFGQIALAALPQHPQFEDLFSQPPMTVTNNAGQQSRVDLRGIEAAVDPNWTFAERKTQIEHKSSDHREKVEKRSQELKAELSLLRTRKFHEVVRESAALIEEVFAEVGESRDLLKFLILEGYLDDTYYQYTSLFHSGRLSRNDNQFLIQIRSFNNPEPDFQLDSISEVIASMREDDFGRTYVLNRFIIDGLLGNTKEHAAKITSALEFIASHVDDCKDFFQSYYARGAHVDRLISTLIRRWPAFIVVALRSDLAVSHAARILTYARNGAIKQGTPAGFTLARFASQELSRILAEGVDFDLSILEALNIQVADVPAIADHHHVVSYIAAEGLYRVSPANIRLVMEQVVKFPTPGDLERKHFTSLREANYGPLLKRIGSNFEAYVQDVLLKLQNNTDEDLPAIIEVLGHDEVPIELRSEFLSLQTTTFPSFVDVPVAFHAALLTEQKIDSTWENCLAFLTSEAFTSEVLTDYLQSEASEGLSRQAIPNTKNALSLRKFVIENDALPDEIYRLYVRKLPLPFTALPDVEANKIRIVIEERRAVFSVDNFTKIDGDDLKALFIELNFEDYRKKRTEFSIGAQVLERLLNSDLADSQKMAVVGDIDPELVSENSSLAAAIGPVLNRSKIKAKSYGSDFVRAVILNSHPEALQISLFNKLHSVLTNVEVRDVLQGLPAPYCDIAIYGRAPRIDSDSANEGFASWLKERKIISSFGPTLFSGGIRISTFRKEPTGE
ncbi:ATP-binding protein [Rhizobium leguminosarum]|uniref:YobI family P-loop NTPase n=1 Tax=Rhizobium leguminosarum TaxID=384 RepID=UPI001C96AF29|nr:ATP-binding protein [Rhizobium leguminosarum]MBY5646012.1 ATP-binding protein [Rhizobium leguminosarum]MBY5707113.1 ATP-binding protein [Rhizobium leguminosarum]